MKRKYRNVRAPSFIVYKLQKISRRLSSCVDKTLDYFWKDSTVTGLILHSKVRGHENVANLVGMLRTRWVILASVYTKDKSQEWKSDTGMLNLMVKVFIPAMAFDKTQSRISLKKSSRKRLVHDFYQWLRSSCHFTARGNIIKRFY